MKKMLMFVFILAINCGIIAYNVTCNRNVEPAQTEQEVQVVKAEVKTEIPVSVTKCTKVNYKGSDRICQEYTTYRIVAE